MIPFKKITQGERISIASFFADKGTAEDMSLFSEWTENEDVYYAILEGRLVFRLQESHINTFSMPYGNGPLRYVLMQILEDSSLMGCKCRITDLTEDDVNDIKSAMPGHFHFEMNEDGELVAVAITNYTNSVFFNNEGMIPN